jgi:hypothetical protein
MFYLKQGKVGQCRMQLGSLKLQSGSFYGKKAGELLKETGSFKIVPP